MGLIVSEVYDALIEAGASPDRAKAAASAVPTAESMATQEDIARLESKLARLEANMATKDDLARLESRLAKVETTMATKGDLARLEMTTRENFSRIDKQIAVLRFAVFSFGPTILALLVKLTFFP